MCVYKQSKAAFLKDKLVTQIQEDINLRMGLLCQEEHRMPYLSLHLILENI